METPAPITFTYGYADYQAQNRLMRRDSLWKRTQFFRVPLAAALGMAAYVVLDAWYRGVSPSGALSGLVGAWQYWAAIAGMIPFIWLLNWIELKVYYHRQRMDGARITITFDKKQGIMSEGPSGTGFLPWSGIRKLVSDAQAHVVLCENRMIGLCLPRRAFASQKDFEAAAVYISSCLTQNRDI